MSGRPTAARVRVCADEVTAVGDRIGRYFARSEPRARSVGYIRGLLSQIAAPRSGVRGPNHHHAAGVGHLLFRAMSNVIGDAPASTVRVRSLLAASW